jgi:hypothetical protein
MLADMVVGEAGTAEVLFLLAAIIAFIEVVFDYAGSRTINFLAIAVTLISIAFFIL